MSIKTSLSLFINKDALTNVKTTFKKFIKDRLFNVTSFINISIPLAPISVGLENYFILTVDDSDVASP